jgi:fatty-acyl-CoA synthase
MLAALEAEPDRWDLSSLRVIISSGVMWSSESKEGLIRHQPQLILVDTYGSSEAIGMGSSVSSKESSAKTASFSLSDKAVVITDDGRLVAPGSGEIGKVGIEGRTPIGYYKDPEKSAATFPVVNGVRYSVPGDFATVEADGSITLLGRGSVCINTGGEKVFPEEVEEALKTFPGVQDAIVVGIPDDRFGQAVTAVVAAEEGFDEAAAIAHVKEHLAAYKAPKRVFTVGSLDRAANGKVDYKRWTSHAETNASS